MQVPNPPFFSTQEFPWAKNSQGGWHSFSRNSLHYLPRKISYNYFFPRNLSHMPCDIKPWCSLALSTTSGRKRSSSGWPESILPGFYLSQYPCVLLEASFQPQNHPQLKYPHFMLRLNMWVSLISSCFLSLSSPTVAVLLTNMCLLNACHMVINRDVVQSWMWK